MRGLGIFGFVAIGLAAACSGAVPANGPEAAVGVQIQSGEDAGTYGGGAPDCTLGGAAGPGVWSIQYGNMLALAGSMSTLQITDEPDSTGGPEDRIFSGYVVIGPVVGGRSYILSIDRFSETPYTHHIDDSGTWATITASGYTVENNPLGPGNVGIAISVVCGSVDRE